MTAHGIDLRSDAIARFCQRWRVKELAVFGSILGDHFGPSSDIDLLVDFEEGADWDLFEALAMEDELTAVLGRKADLVSRWAIEHDSNQTVRREVLGSAEVIYAQG